MAKEKMSVKEKLCVTPKALLSFPALFKPKGFQGQQEMYSCDLNFPKNTDLTDLKRAANNACIETWGVDKKKWPKLRSPFKDGNEKADLPGYADTIFITAKSKTSPGMVDQNRLRITNEDELYAGCYVRAEVIAYTYEKAGNIGVGFSLQNVQKWADGTRLSGRRDAEEVFDVIEDESEDKGNYEDDDDDGPGF